MLTKKKPKYKNARLAKLLPSANQATYKTDRAPIAPFDFGLLPSDVRNEVVSYLPPKESLILESLCKQFNAEIWAKKKSVTISLYGASMVAHKLARCSSLRITSWPGSPRSTALRRSGEMAKVLSLLTNKAIPCFASLKALQIDEYMGDDCIATYPPSYQLDCRALTALTRAIIDRVSPQLVSLTCPWNLVSFLPQGMNNLLDIGMASSKSEVDFGKLHLVAPNLQRLTFRHIYYPRHELNARELIDLKNFKDIKQVNLLLVKGGDAPELSTFEGAHKLFVDHPTLESVEFNKSASPNLTTSAACEEWLDKASKVTDTRVRKALLDVWTPRDSGSCFALVPPCTDYAYLTKLASTADVNLKQVVNFTYIVVNPVPNIEADLKTFLSLIWPELIANDLKLDTLMTNACKRGAPRFLAWLLKRWPSKAPAPLPIARWVSECVTSGRPESLEIIESLLNQFTLTSEQGTLLLAHWFNRPEIRQLLLQHVSISTTSTQGAEFLHQYHEVMKNCPDEKISYDELAGMGLPMTLRVAETGMTAAMMCADSRSLGNALGSLNLPVDDTDNDQNTLFHHIMKGTTSKFYGCLGVDTRVVARMVRLRHNFCACNKLGHTPADQFLSHQTNEGLLDGFTAFVAQLRKNWEVKEPPNATDDPLYEALAISAFIKKPIHNHYNTTSQDVKVFIAKLLAKKCSMQLAERYLGCLKFVANCDSGNDEDAKLFGSRILGHLQALEDIGQGVKNEIKVYEIVSGMHNPIFRHDVALALHTVGATVTKFLAKAASVQKVPADFVDLLEKFAKEEGANKEEVSAKEEKPKNTTAKKAVKKADKKSGKKAASVASKIKPDEPEADEKDHVADSTDAVVEVAVQEEKKKKRKRDSGSDGVNNDNDGDDAMKASASKKGKKDAAEDSSESVSLAGSRLRGSTRSAQ